MALARSGRGVGSLAREFEACAVTIAGWVRQAGIDGGARGDGLASAERGDLRRLHTESRHPRVERDVLSKAAAWLAWLKALRDDKRAIFRAAAEAQKAVDLIR